MAKKNNVGETTNNESVEVKEDAVIDNTQTLSIDTAQFIINTMNSLINYINTAHSRGAFTLEESGTIWNIIKSAQDRLK